MFLYIRQLMFSSLRFLCLFVRLFYRIDSSRKLIQLQAYSLFHSYLSFKFHIDFWSDLKLICEILWILMLLFLVYLTQSTNQRLISNWLELFLYRFLMCSLNWYVTFEVIDRVINLNFDYGWLTQLYLVHFLGWLQCN